MSEYILQICDYSAPYKGNFISSLLYLEEKLNRIDKKIIYLFPYRVQFTAAKAWIESLKEEGKEIYIQEKNFYKNFLLIRRIIKQYNIGIVFKHFIDTKTDIILKSFGGKLKVYRFFHGMPDINLSNKRKKLFKFLYKKNKLIGVSEAVSKKLKEIYPKEQIITIENAIAFDRLKEMDNDFTREENLSFLTMGYNYYIKGVDLTLEVFNELTKKYNIKLYIATAINKEPLIEKITERFGEVPSWIQILPPTDKIATYYRNIDFFLGPSRSEGFCYAIVEAAYCGETIIASKIPAQGDLEVDNIYWFESENIQDYAKVVELAIANAKTDKEKKAEIAKKVKIRYSLETWARKIENELVDGTKS